MSLLDGFGGTVDGSFYKAPPFVDFKRYPGESSFLLDETWTGNLRKYIKGILTLSFFFYSPNLIWFLLTVIQWKLFPYDLSGETPLLQIFLDRLILNILSAWLYYSYWHFSIELWCSRPFAGRKRPLVDAKVYHNVFYTTLGAVQWALTEFAFIYGYRTGRLAYKDATQASIVVWSLLVPLIRDVHFYFAHRFIHVRFLYKYIHCLHHRCADIEPFAGLSMHPVEHLYYFTCYAPLLWTAASGISVHPFLFSWMGVHALLAPAASHSGYEDHWSADPHHAAHHRYFECNYGSAGLLLTDMWMGTLRDKLDSRQQVPLDSKATLVGPPEGVSYYLFGVVLPAVAFWYSLIHFAGRLDPPWVSLVSLVLAAWPIIAAALLHALSYRRKQSLWKHYMAPFDRDTLPAIVVHSIMGGIICCIWPVYSLIRMLLQ